MMRHESVYTVSKLLRAPKGKALTVAERKSGVAWYEIGFKCNTTDRYAHTDHYICHELYKGTFTEMLEYTSRSHLCDPCRRRLMRGY